VTELRGGLLYFDCFSGIAGDMAVAALVDLGVPQSIISETLWKLHIQIRFERVKRGALTGLKLHVLDEESPDHDHHEHDHHQHRHYSDIKKSIGNSDIADGIKARSISMFERIAAVEAKLHGVAVEEVAFHEVGAVDSIADVVGAAAALDWLAPARIFARRVPLGRGSVETAHGRLPIPAPATLELLRGAPVEEGGADCELTTPTGAAILAATVDEWGALPAMEVAGVGWGAGERELPDRPNLLRVVAGVARAARAGEGAFVVEANVDDQSPELTATLIEKLMQAGARDAWLQPVVMKKGRPGLIVGALVDGDRREAVARALLVESSTIGVRAHAVERAVLDRRTVEVDTPWGKVAVKVAGDGADLNAAPEYESCRAVAERAGVPLKRIYAEALAALFRR